MNFHTYTTTREACKRSGAIDDPKEFYRVASADAVKMGSGQFLGQLYNERDWEKARRPVWAWGRINMRVFSMLLLTLAFGCHDPSSTNKGAPEMRVSTEVSSDQSVPLAERLVAARQALRKHVEDLALARYADDLEKVARVSIRLKAKVALEGELQPGSSKLGGTPDLPEGVAWPECDGVPMALLAQLRMEDVAPHDPDGRLPKSGMLYFFYEACEQKWGFDPKDRGHWKVVFHDGDPAGLRSVPPPANLPEECRFRTCKLAFSNEITLPSWDSREIAGLKLSEKEADRYIELLDAIHPEGYADPRAATLEKGAEDWKLLLQIDSDEENLGVMWGDCGRVYFWIRQQDLQKRDFSNVWLILQCY